VRSRSRWRASPSRGRASSPRRWCRRRIRRPRLGIEKTLLNKWYVDEAYATTVVKPTLGISRNLLWKGIDTGIIDGLLVNGSAGLTRALGWCGSQLQSGRVGTYAWVLLLGVLSVLSAFSFR
jgi:NADH-quinone oxidoreductase subunit L